ncbi:hypothetical protein Q1695_000860 [Nippostrongylus brasiliensis]|nr:hypothetical protein Q1695_000860 [Nippostrongylus brasiliensis]
MSRIKPHQHLSDAVEEDLLDMDIAESEATLAELQNSTLKKHRPSRKQRRKRLADVAEEANTEEPPAKRSPKTTMPKPKMTLRPLLVAQEETPVMSNKDIRDIFYAVMDGVQGNSRKLDRLEDCLRSMDGRLRVLEEWIMNSETRKKKEFVAMQPGCPAVPNSRYCEVCYVSGHQAAECRSKARMDPAHVEQIYKSKNICKKCHCVHS